MGGAAANSGNPAAVHTSACGVPNLVCVEEVHAASSTRAALSKELGFYPAGTDPDSVARHRREAAADAAAHAEWLRLFGPDGYRRNQYRHSVEQKRQEAVEAAGRAAVADL